MIILYAGEWCSFWGFLQPFKAGLQISKAPDLLLKACRQRDWYSELKCPKPFPKHFIMPDTIISLIVTHNGIKGLPTQTAICSFTPAWQGYYMELVLLNRADKARCHPCQHTFYIWGNLRTLWLKEILLLPNTDWQQKCFTALFFSLNDCNSFCNLCKGSGQKGAGDGLSLSSCRITKGTAQWGMCRKPQGREIREQRGRTQAWEIHSPPKPAYGNLMNVDLS